MLSFMLEFPQKLHTRRRKRLKSPDRESISPNKISWYLYVCVPADT